MSGQSGLKHVDTEPTRVETKRERRRGAAGRAAALRRAPSDSDCSGETASLSADSGERSARPAPPPPRQAKTRRRFSISSRRRGSEWEVLEGLKDGQRFEKRPEVFNGYLHKKRKWPLKGWHKRFFVIDGGIVVYARSAADVSRGRLHGSVDVGLSVISAKARRRRIDIDADEFIYHLRAKTPDVFRTWLNVLKAHRLYRQHLLTFGARESVPKIHAPLEDQPPADSSSLTSIPRKLSNEILQSKWPVANSLVYTLCDMKTDYNSTYTSKPFRKRKDQNVFVEGILSPIDDTEDKLDIKENKLDGTEVQEIYHKNENISMVVANENHGYRNYVNYKNRSCVSTCCNSGGSSQTVLNKTDDKQKQTLFVGDAVETPTYFFFERDIYSRPVVRKSKKSTNVVKYRNIYDEPRLRKPLNKVMLLTKYKLKNEYNTLELNDFEPDKKMVTKNAHTQIKEDKVHKDTQNSFTPLQYDEIAESLMVSVITNNSKDSNTKSCINHVIQELYDVREDRSSEHPVKHLFRGLLEYWLNNTTSENWRDLIKKTKSVQRQSSMYFSKDQSTSNVDLPKVSKCTQFHGISDLIRDKALEMPVQNPGKKNRLACKINDSFEKERRIQELERILKNTIYICETVRSSHSKEKDIQITRTLIDKLDKYSQQNILNKSDEEITCDNSNSSNELPKIQETIKHLISETSIPADVAKEFLGAYLNLLRPSQSDEGSTPSSDESKCNLCNKCDVVGEPVQKKVSKSISTKDNEEYSNKDHCIDPGQLYLKNVLDTITTIFSSEIKTRVKKNRANNWTEIKVNDGLGRVQQSPSKDNSLVVDVSKYDMKHISMTSDPSVKDIAMKLKEKPPISGERKSMDLSMKFSDESKITKKNVFPVESSESNKMFDIKSKIRNFITPIPYRNVQDYLDKEAEELRPYSSSHADSHHFTLNDRHVKDWSTLSGGTSKAYRKYVPTCSTGKANTNKAQRDETDSIKTQNDEDLQSCFILSLKKGSLTSKYQKKKPTSCEGRHELFSQKHEPSCSSNLDQEQISMLGKVPNVIDEKYILTLLENLTILSRKVPNINKDINNFYIKLRKKHEKMFIDCNKMQGLSLLGKIYQVDSTAKTTDDNETQFDETIFPRAVTIATNNTTTSTSDNIVNRNQNDKAVDSIVGTETLNKYIQVEITDAINNEHVVNISKGKIFGKDPNTSSTQTTSYSSLSSEGELQTTERAISNPNWYKTVCTRDCGISTLIKCVMSRTDNSQNFRFKTQGGIGKSEKEVLTTKKVKNVRMQSPEIRQNLIKEIALLSPSFKVSTQSQTEKKLRCLRTQCPSKDYQVYQLFISHKYEAKKSCSMLNFIVKSDISDDLITLYRCNSDTSYISGLVSPSPARGPQAGFVAGTPGGRFAGWILDAGCPLESASRELGQAQLSVQQLQRLLAALELQQQQHHDTDIDKVKKVGVDVL